MKKLVRKPLEEEGVQNAFSRKTMSCFSKDNSSVSESVSALSTLGVSCNWIAAQNDIKNKRNHAPLLMNSKKKKVCHIKAGLHNQLRNPNWPEVVAVDCEMVAIGDSKTNVLARVVIIDENKNVLLDNYVKPVEKVTDFKTSITGLKWNDLKNGQPYKTVRWKALELLKGKIIIGHDLRHDLKALLYCCPLREKRDTALYRPLRHGPKNCHMNTIPSLKNLSMYWLDRHIQSGTHNPIEDATAALDLYLLHRDEWEETIT